MVSSDSLMTIYFQNSKSKALELLTYSVTSKADYIFVPWELFPFMELLHCITAKVYRKENAEQYVHFTTFIELIYKFIECTILSNNIGFGTF